MSDYSDIIDHPHHQSAVRPHMSMTARAAQFSPYAALVGYGDAVEEEGRLTDGKAVLDEDAIAQINRKLSEVTEGVTNVSITWFIPDIFKEGGSYTVTGGTVKKLDRVEQKIIMTDGTVIPVDDIFDISLS